MNSNNQLITDYAILAETSYANFKKLASVGWALVAHAVEHNKQCSHFSGSLKHSDD